MRRHYVLIIIWLILSIYGTMMAFSAGYINTLLAGGFIYSHIIKQSVIIIILLILVYIFLLRKKITFYKTMKVLAPTLFIISLGLLVAVLIIGSERNNAKMVFDLFIVDFQPLELYKITIIMFLATRLEKIDHDVNLLELLSKVILPLFGSCLIILQPDLGGAIICAAVVYFMLIYNGQKVLQLIQLAAAGFIFAAISSFALLQAYQLDRITTWLNPFASSSGYQLQQSFIAISNGGLFGRGFMASAQKSFLPVPDSDFIFAIICEELGLIGAIFTVSLIFALALYIIYIGTKAHERFGMLYCFGIATLIVIQTIVNIGGVSGLIPMTGVTLPFISSGINSFIFLSIGVFAVIPISRESDIVKKKY